MRSIWWLKKSYDLNCLADAVEFFFREKGFKITKHQEEAGKILITVYPKPGTDILGRIKVILSSSSDQLSIEFTYSSLSRVLRLFGTLASYFGMGYLVLKGLKSEEEIERIEKEFWIYISRIIHALEMTKKE